MDLSNILSRLGGVRANGDGRYMARCPAHEDNTASLSIKDGGDRALLHCFGGCNAVDVLAAINLDWTDAFAAMTPQRGAHKPRLVARELKAAAHTYANELTMVRVANEIGTDFSEPRKARALEHARARLARFADEHGLDALARVSQIHKETYWYTSRERQE